MNKYIVTYKTPNGTKGQHEFATYENAKEIYLSLAKNLTIKSAKLFKIEDGEKYLIEKFTKKFIYTMKGECL